MATSEPTGPTGPSTDTEATAEFILCERQDLENIGNAVREKIGSTDKMNIKNVPSAITNIPGSFFKNEIDLLGTENNIRGDFSAIIECREAPASIYLLVDQTGKKLDNVNVTESMYVFARQDDLEVSGFGNNFSISVTGEKINLNHHCVGYASGNSGTAKRKIILVAVDNEGNTHHTMFRLSWAVNPCYLKNTKIALYDGTIKNVQDITYEDELLAWDFDNGCFVAVKPLWIKKAQTTNEYFHCVFENEINLDLINRDNHAHRVFCLDTNQFEYANDCVGKMVMTNNGPVKMLSCEIIKDEVEFYNIITNYHMNCYANSILTSTGFSNIYLIENMKYIKEDRELIPIEAFDNCPESYYTGLRLGEQKNYTIERINEKIHRMVELALPNGN